MLLGEGRRDYFCSNSSCCYVYVHSSTSNTKGNLKSSVWFGWRCCLLGSRRTALVASPSPPPSSSCGQSFLIKKFEGGWQVGGGSSIDATVLQGLSCKGIPLLTQVKIEDDKIPFSSSPFLVFSLKWKHSQSTALQFPWARIFRFQRPGRQAAAAGCSTRSRARVSNLITYELLQAKLKVMIAVGWNFL